MTAVMIILVKGFRKQGTYMDVGFDVNHRCPTFLATYLMITFTHICEPVIKAEILNL